MYASTEGLILLLNIMISSEFCIESYLQICGISYAVSIFDLPAATAAVNSNGSRPVRRPSSSNVLRIS